MSMSEGTSKLEKRVKKATRKLHRPEVRTTQPIFYASSDQFRMEELPDKLTSESAVVRPVPESHTPFLLKHGELRGYSVEADGKRSAVVSKDDSLAFEKAKSQPGREVRIRSLARQPSALHAVCAYDLFRRDQQIGRLETAIGVVTRSKGGAVIVHQSPTSESYLFFSSGNAIGARVQDDSDMITQKEGLAAFLTLASNRMGNVYLQSKVPEHILVNAGFRSTPPEEVQGLLSELTTQDVTLANMLFNIRSYGAGATTLSQSPNYAIKVHKDGKLIGMLAFEDNTYSGGIINDGTAYTADSAMLHALELGKDPTITFSISPDDEIQPFVTQKHPSTRSQLSLYSTYLANQ